MGGIFGFVFIFIIWVVVSALRTQLSGQRNNDPKSTDDGDANYTMHDAALAAREALHDARRSAEVFLRDEKPVIKHSTDDCTGGSIHTDYHEGTPMRPLASSNSVQRAGTLGNQGVLGTEGRPFSERNRPNAGSGYHDTGRPRDTGKPRSATQQRRDTAASAVATISTAPASSDAAPVPSAAAQLNGAERLQKSIAAYPAAVQGVIWSEILNRPLAERQ
ncbi:MAG: hypothetical protein J1E60_04510 [Christensenellaceae bacterium]|nr:hypothetical protein [Christensenellaceae bacterium]